MGNEIQVFEQQLTALAPKFEQVLTHSGVPVERLVRTIVVSVERNPRLLDCTRQSLMNAAMSAAVLGLEVDGVTGQAFLIPFKDHAQLVVGYKGYNTMAARSGYTITGAIVREGDDLLFELGSQGFVRHKPKLGNKGRIIGAWACAVHKDRPPVPMVMDIDELMAVKNRAPGAKKKDSPWNDPSVGFPAMCEKTVKRRLARSMPLNVMQYGARMDEAFEEEGKPAWVTPEKGVIIDGEADDVIPPADARQEPIDVTPASYTIELRDGTVRSFSAAHEWAGAMKQGIPKQVSSAVLQELYDRNRGTLEEIRESDPGLAGSVDDVYNRKMTALIKEGH